MLLFICIRRRRNLICWLQGTLTSPLGPPALLRTRQLAPLSPHHYLLPTLNPVRGRDEWLNTECRIGALWVDALLESGLCEYLELHGDKIWFALRQSLSTKYVPKPMKSSDLPCFYWTHVFTIQMVLKHNVQEGRGSQLNIPQEGVQDN